MAKRNTPKRIESLTEEQKARFPEFVDKWTRIGLSTDPADRQKSERAIAGLYRLASLKEPRVIWLPCPISAAMSAVMYAYIRNEKGPSKKDAVDSAVRSAVGSAVDSAVGSAVDSAVRSAVYSAVDLAVGSAVGSAVDLAVGSAVGSAVDSAVRSAVGSAVDSAVDSAVYSAVYSAVGSAVRSAVGSAVDSAVGSAVDSAVDSAVRSAGRSYHGGSIWGAGYAAWADYFNEVIGISIDRNYLDMVESCGFYWLLDDVCFASERPAHINLDDRGLLHSETGQSISYPSGWGLCHHHGTQVPADWIFNKASLTPEVALGWDNVEQRRAACEIIGWAKILKQLNAKTIDKDDDPEIGELVEVNLPGAGKERFLRVLCGTKREFALPVPPTEKTALSANAWTYAIPTNLLQQKEYRT